MSETAKILLFLVSCVLTDNFVFTRYFGERAAFSETGKISTSALLGAAVALVMAVTSVVTSVLYRYVLIPLGFEYLSVALFVLVIVAVLWLANHLLRVNNPFHLAEPTAFHGLIAVNSAVLGAALLGASSDYAFLYGALNGVFGGLGFLLAVVLMAGVRERVALSDVPESLRGLPISLVSAGLIGLAFLGFSGFARSLVW